MTGDEAIAEAFAKRDAAVVQTLLKNHIADAHRDVIEELKQASM